MITAAEGRECRPVVRSRDGSERTVQAVQNALEAAANSIGIPVAFYEDQVKSGGIFNKTIENCIVLYHPEHQYDYFKFCIRIATEGSYAFISCNDFGQSKQMNKADRVEAYKEDRRGKSMSYKVGSIIGQGISSIGKSKQKLEEEQNYYNCISDILDDVISYDN